MSGNPLLPEGIVAMLRGEVGYPAEWENLAESARERYQEGRAGQPYEFEPPPDGLFPADIVEIVENLLRRCWEQGRRDTGEVTDNADQA